MKIDMNDTRLTRAERRYLAALVDRLAGAKINTL